ncbi:MAG: ATP-binding protein, partial [Gemmatimonadota bacterium]
RVKALNAALQAQRVTARERERLVAILEATSDLVCVITPDLKLSYVNAAGRRLLGIGLDEPLDRFDSGEFLADSEVERRTDVQLLATESGVLELERTFRRLDGSPVLVSQVLLVQRSADGAVEFIASIARDIGDQRRQEQALRQAQKMEAVGQLAGGVAHDFNNLLTVILNCGESLAESLPISDERHEEALEIVQASQRAARLTRQLLAFSRQQVMEARNVDLNALIRNLLVMLRRLVGDHVRLVEQLDERLPLVYVDSSQFEQVLVNLVVNARDAMPLGGAITIRTSVEAVGEQSFSVLEVKDTGVGMDDATRARIFEPFFTTKQMGHGTGLGLAMVAGIVAQSGGEISVESAPARGTTFRLQLPALDESAHAPLPIHRREALAGDSLPPAATGARQRIIVVEDQDAVRHMTARMLVAEGYDVSQARSADEAYRFLNDGKEVALVLTDVEMPGVSGRTLARTLEHDPRRIPVLFMSGYTNDSLLLRGALPPNASFLAKPFTHASLRVALRKALQQ